MRENEINAIQVFFDGSCAPTNPGFTGGIGVLILLPSQEVKISKPVKSQNIFSNNSTEYLALIEALNYLLDSQLQNQRIEVFGDSNLVISQMQGKWKVGKGFYRAQALECMHLSKEFTDISFKWIPRELNYKANELSIQFYGEFVRK